MKPKTRILCMGVAGCEFNNFNVVFRDNLHYGVVTSTATEIPDEEGRHHSPALAGSLYSQGIPIRSEDELESSIIDQRIDQSEG